MPIPSPEYRRQWRDKHPDANAEYTRRWREKNPYYLSNWRRTNRSRCAAMVAERKASKLQATPGWLTDEDHANIAEIYETSSRLTAETGIRHEVDHIVPLAGQDVRGLHVPWNLQVLTREQNAKKGNR